ncbi:uncharacterized protein LOC107272158 isoform X1 [Cephus cinctus]|uniref:Uncharacterized protein LOC107272158 isoform X1 n=1 Tax=Cephus cinctus TaxID=211228 RepID=A0AAJ7FRC7_CEPCN|nr:uncharacterized protein LOC107272158 isoform X1 [Cephus cinctus]
MNSRDTKIQNILKDYLKQQQELEEKLLECRSSRYETQRIISEKVSRDKSDSTNFKLTPEEAHKRNRQLLQSIIYLQDLESVKARLRTIASFTPTDQELVDTARTYRKRMRLKNQV